MLQSPAIIKIIKPSEKDSFLVFDSPHSGIIYPDNFYHICARADLLRTADHYVDELFDFAPDLGASFLSAHFPRCYVDVNRSEHDLDPLLIDDIPDTITAYPPHDYRSPMGHGVLRRLVQQGQKIYDKKLSWEEASHRLDHYYKPYYEQLNKLITSAYQTHKKAIHINCHAMPNHVAMTRSTGFQLWSRSVDICLGNLNGLAASNAITKELEKLLKSKGYRVSLNDPYQGAEILRRIGKPENNIHSIQIELNKSLYMNEKTGNKTNDFNALKENLKSVFEEFLSTM
jgi:N-formylglutamate deformylase